jgi:hypothetical protein
MAIISDSNGGFKRLQHQTAEADPQPFFFEILLRFLAAKFPNLPTVATSAFSSSAFRFIPKTKKPPIPCRTDGFLSLFRHPAASPHPISIDEKGRCDYFLGSS